MPSFLCSFLGIFAKGFCSIPKQHISIFVFTLPSVLSVHPGLLQTITQKPPVSATALTRRTLVLLHNLSPSDFSCRPKDAFRAIKKRIVGNKNFHEVMLALTVSDRVSFSAL